jgi:hypothetical protein
MSYLADLFSVPAMKTWELLTFSEMEWIQKGQNSFFRTYGGTHIKAFFPVAIEKNLRPPKKCPIIIINYMTICV